MKKEKEQEKDLKKLILKYTLWNALDYGGKASTNSVLGKILGDRAELREQAVEIKEMVEKAVQEVNKLSLEEQKKKLGSGVKREKKEKVKEKLELPELPDAQQGKVVTRIPPEPSKHLHIGHALSFLLNYLYAKRYKGKCLVRFEDCNPEIVKQEFVDSNLDDIKNYLGIKVSAIKFVSDGMPLLYGYAEKLIKNGNAFICFCSREKMQSLRHEGKECECRKHVAEKNMQEWKKFVSGKYMNGEAILRLKGDMKNPNHILRDPVIFRAVKEKHFRQGNKYKVWPLYDFYNSIEDSLMKVTHILRSQEFEQRVPLHDMIKEMLGLSKQIAVHYGRFNVLETTTKGREIRELIESGEYIGWDDPRLVTLKALRRRGITREAFYELTKTLGLSRYQVNLDFALIASINRKILDRQADRYFFVPEPVKVEISNPPKIKFVKIKMHPDKKKERKVKAGKEIFISHDDYSKLKGKEIRLMSFCNINLDKNKKAKFTSLENKDIQKIQWVAKDAEVKMRVFMPDAKWLEGVSEKSIKKIKEGDVIQFERFGFCRLDRINKSKGIYEFWFGHK